MIAVSVILMLKMWYSGLTWQ